MRPLDPFVRDLAPLGSEEMSGAEGSDALRARLEWVRSNTFDLTRSALGGGGLSLLPLATRWREKGEKRV